MAISHCHQPGKNNWKAVRIMKPFWSLLLILLIAASCAIADDAKPGDETSAPEKKVDAKANAQKAAETIEALGKVFEVFGAAFGGRPNVAEEAIAVEAVVAGEMAIDVLDGDAVAAGGDPFEQQFRQQFRQLSKGELNFVRAVCQPDAEQSKKIKAAGDLGMKTAVKQFAEVQKKMQQGIRAGQEPQWPDPRKIISDALLKSVKESLSADQAKRYEAELEKRSAARKRAALLNLVAKLDKDLVLTADQRGKLSEALSTNWKDEWGQQIEVFMYGDTYMPVLPDAQVVPILTEKQKQIWTAIPKNQNQIWGWAGGGFIQAGEIEEGGAAILESVVDEKADEPKKGEEKKDEKP